MSLFMKKLFIVSSLLLATLSSAHANTTRSMYDYISLNQDWSLNRLEKMPNLKKSTKTIDNNSVFFGVKSNYIQDISFENTNYNNAVDVVHFLYGMAHFSELDYKDVLPKLINKQNIKAISKPNNCKESNSTEYPKTEYAYYKWNKPNYKPLYIYTFAEFNNGGTSGSISVAKNIEDLCNSQYEISY